MTYSGERPDPRTLIAQISKDLKLDDDVLVMGADLKDRKVPRASTGILALDVALGGGLPLNQWAEFTGHESSGKTALALKIVAHQQAADPDWFCVWVAAEELEESYAEALGVDLDRMLIVDTNSMEDAYDVVLELAEKQAFDGVVIDSLPALIPTGEYEGQMEDSGGMAQAARLNGKFFRKMGADGNRSLVNEERPWIGILINQWRCLPSETLVPTPSGFFELRELQPGDAVLSPSGPVEVRGVVDSGSVLGVSLQLRDLGEYRVSDNHQQPVFRDDVRMTTVLGKDVVPGDWVAVPQTQHEYAQDRPSSREEVLDAAVLGAYFADGHCSSAPDRYLDISETSEERRSLVRMLLTRKFGKDFSNVTSRLCRVHGVGLDFLAEHNLAVNGAQKIVPEFVRRGGPYVVREFLRYASFDTHGFDRNRFYWTFESARQARDIAGLLQGFGVYADVTSSRATGENTYLSISGSDAVRYQEVIGFAEPTKASFWFTETTSGARGKRDHVPPALFEGVFLEARRRKLPGISHAPHYSALNQIAHQEGVLLASRERLVEFCAWAATIDPYFEDLTWLLLRNRFDRVESVEPCAFQAHDIEVDGGLFVAGRVLTHNSKIGVMFGDPRTTPGGVAKNYACYVRLETKRDEWLDNELKKSDPKYETVGQTIVTKIMKNKAGPPGREAAFNFYFAPFGEFDLGSIDRLQDVFNTAVTLGVMEREGNSYYFLGEKIGPNKPRTIEALRSDPALVDSVSTQVFNHVARKAGAEPEAPRRPKRVKRS